MLYYFSLCLEGRVKAQFREWNRMNCECNMLHMCRFLQEDRVETQEKNLSWQPEKDDRNSR